MSPVKSYSELKATVLFSGGLDSTACIYFLQQRGFAVAGLFVDFGQLSSEAEWRAVERLRERLGISVSALTLTGFTGTTTGELFGRNMLLISAALFVTGGASCVIGLGIHFGTTYYDCSPDFLNSLQRLVAAQSDGQVSLFAPFIRWTKRDIYDYAVNHNLPLDDTYSCERGIEPCCGVCASCQDRKELHC